MGKTIAIYCLAVILGFVVGSGVMMGIHKASEPMYPPPEGLDLQDPDQREEVKAWMETLPDGAFVIALLAHWAGTAAAAAVAMLVIGRRSIRPALIMGVLFTLAGIANIAMMPHPAWFPFADLIGYLPVAWLVGKCLLRAPTSEATPA